mgnify:CR=1 FL=1
MNQTEDAVSVNIVVLPNAEVTQKAIDLSNKISKTIDTHFVLNNDTLFPHITIYQAHYPNHNIEKIKNTLLSLSQTIHPISIQMKNFSVMYDTFIFWNCVKTQELLSIHQRMVDLFNPFREGLIIPNLALIENMDEVGKSEIAQYGSLLIGPRFTPHITITRIKNSEKSLEILEALKTENANDTFETTEIVLGYLGDHGTVKGIIKKYPL